jgi:hypothetical protein
MSNITTELKTSKEKEVIEMNGDSAVKAVLLLEQGDSAEDLRIANALGSSNNIARAQTELGKKMELEKLDGKFAGNVFTVDQIKALAGKYNLRFLRSGLYCGNLDVVAIQKIKEFSRETGTAITDGALKYNFFILAPGKCFNLKAIEKVKVDPDPAIFYKIDDDHYRLIHQWGNDFSIWNRIAGWNWLKPATKFWVNLIAFSLIFCGLVFVTGLFVPLFTSKWAYSIALAVAVIISNISAFGGFWEKEYFHDNKWNSDAKIAEEW